MCVLSIFLTGIAVGTRRAEFLTKFTFDITADIFSGDVSNTHRVSSHIGNQTDRAFFAHSDAFIKLLRYHHRLFSSKIQTLHCFLLQAAGSERRQRITFTLLFRCFFNNISSFSQSLFYNSRFFSRANFQLFTQMFDDLCFKNRCFCFFAQLRIQRPVFFGYKISNFFFPVSNNFYCYRLHASGTQAFSDFPPQQRAELITHDTVNNTACLLRVDFIQIDRTRIFQRVFDGAGRDLVKFDPTVCFRVDAQNMC